jgi:hypothetical protein
MIPQLLPAALAALTFAPQQAPDAWQQGVSYRIEARLDEDDETLSGRARVWYRNESPDTLRDFYLHLYLNAFRPNSEWARTDLEHGIRTFQDLMPEEQGFERLQQARVDGTAATVFYPFAPDSTVARVALPVPVPPGGEIVLDYDWSARPSTVARRQGRRGRHYDFAQWYPRVAVYDLEGWRDHPLYRQGEFYGEFATYDVTLDVASDQVIGATGVPVEGDPGWEGAAVPGTGPVELQSDWYGTMQGPPCVVRDGLRTCGVPVRRELEPGEPLGLLDGQAAAGRKQVRWHAEDVHHFAWSTSPDYIYEQGMYDDVAIHVLYRPGDREQWGDGKAVERTAVALRWLNTVFGRYPYPQVTNLHRLEGGGTEFPMMVMNGSASQGLILHEVGHIYTYGILANNEWYEGWMDEGFTSFQTAWYFEEQGAGRSQWLGSETQVLGLELHGVAEPVTLQAERYSEMGVYSSMIYTKGSLVLWMLREMAGKEKMLEITRTYFERYKFHHVDQHALQSVAEEVMRQDLDWFFGEWLHATGVVDYALEGVHVAREGSSWVTRVDVSRRGEMRMPVPIRLTGGDEVRDTVVPGDALHATHVVRTSFEPRAVRLDPRLVTMDWNALDNAWPSGPMSGATYARGFDNPLGGLPVYRDRAALRFFPLAWYNDAGGIVGGLQVRTSYMGDMRRALLRIGGPGVEGAGVGATSTATDPGSLYFLLENPILFDRPRFGLTIEGFGGEGRGFFRLAGERDISAMPLSGPRRSVRASIAVAGIYDSTYVHPGRWLPDTHLEVEGGLGFRRTGRLWTTDLSGSAGLTTDDRIYMRGILISQLAATTRSGWTMGMRFFAGGAMAREGTVWRGERAPRERQMFLSGGDPLVELSNPWMRSAGSVLDEEGWVEGGGQLLGYDIGLSFAQLLTLTADARTSPIGLGLGLQAAARVFGGVGLGSKPWPVDGPAVLADLTVPIEGWNHAYASAGAGVELGLARSPIRLRVDVPFFVADPELATLARIDQLGFRYTVRLIGYR